MEKTSEKQPQKQLEAQYDQYVAQFRELLESGQSKGREALESAMTTARENLITLGEISAEQGKLFTGYLKRDLAQTAKDMAELGEDARERLQPSRLGAGALAATAEALRMLGHGLLNLSDKTDESITYRAGEITSAGTLTCLKCGDKRQLRKTSLIETCPACSGTFFKKSY